MPETEIDIEKRNKYGMLCGIVGIFLNLTLFAGKLFAGMLSGAISITADAFNKLSDAGSSIITIAGFKMAAQRADEETSCPFSYQPTKVYPLLGDAETMHVLPNTYCPAPDTLPPVS
jgi:hypothetical protein